MRKLTLPALALLALAACDGGTPDAEAPAIPVETATPAPTPAASATPVATEIPAAIQGRWGMVKADCDPSRDDAKGLVTIDATTLEFYESVATLKSIEDSAANRLRGAFEFEGEGMTWQLDMVLDLQDGGATLIRREVGDDAAPVPSRYGKCA